MPARAMRLDKIKRPAGVFAFDVRLATVDGAGSWLHYPIGSTWRAPHDAGTMPFDALLLVTAGLPFVSWWVDDPDDPRVEIDICIPPTETDDGWSFVDLELDPVRHEQTGIVEIEDLDEFEDACRRGWISEDEAAVARSAASRMKAVLVDRTEPWGDEGWRRLNSLRSLA